MSLTLHLLNCYFVVRKCKASLVNLEKIIFLIILKLEINPTPCLHCIIKKNTNFCTWNLLVFIVRYEKLTMITQNFGVNVMMEFLWFLIIVYLPKISFVCWESKFMVVYFCHLYNHAIIINIINSFYLGTTISLNALMKDSNDVSRYFNLFECEIPLIPCDSNVIVKLITLLLTVRVCMLMILFFYYYCHINNWYLI